MPSNPRVHCRMKEAWEIICDDDTCVLCHRLHQTASVVRFRLDVRNIMRVGSRGARLIVDHPVDNKLRETI